MPFDRGTLIRPLITIVVYTVVVTIGFVIYYYAGREESWCNELLKAGDCERFEADKSCYCIDELHDQDGLAAVSNYYENAQAKCRGLNGSLATPDQTGEAAPVQWLAKRMYKLGIEKALVGLRKIGAVWFWLKQDGQVPANELPWREGIQQNQNDDYAMLNVETVNKSTDGGDEKTNNYDHYIENDPEYQWFGFSTQGNIFDGGKVHYICNFTSKPAAVLNNGEENPTTYEPTTRDPCWCAQDASIQLSSLDDSVTLTSPRYPKNYCANQDCGWLFSTQPGLAVKLEWIIFNIENQMDFLRIYDGDQTTKDALIQTCTGDLCSDARSSENLMRLEFSSDHVTVDLGFKAIVTAVQNDPCYCSASSEIRFSRVDESYTISSPKYPQPYCPDYICKWTVFAPPAVGLRILWNEFNIGDDELSIFDGNLEEQENLLKTCNGTECDVSEVISSGQALHINFVSGKERPKESGFNGIITTVTNYCEKSNLHPQGGNITFSDTREGDKVPVRATATIDCSVGHKIADTIDTTTDTVACQSPQWNRHLQKCVPVCDLNITTYSSTDSVDDVHICDFGPDKQDMFAMEKVGDSKNITLHHYPPDEHLLTAAGTSEIFMCNDSEWSPYPPVCHHSAVLLFGGNSISGPEGSIDIYYPQNKQSHQFSVSLMRPRTEHVVGMSRDGQVLIAGGTVGTEYASKSVEVLDLKTNTISSLPSMTEGRNKAAAAGSTRYGRVFVCGGTDKAQETYPQQEPSRSCEYFDSLQNRWVTAGQLNRGRLGHGMVVVDDLRVIYNPPQTYVLVIGGDGGLARADQNGDPYVRSMERYAVTPSYNPYSHKGWELVKQSRDPNAQDVGRAGLSFGRAHFAVTIDQSYIYICGGEAWVEGVRETVETCEMFDLQQHQIWYKTSPMQVARQGFSMVAFNGRLFAFGGYKDQLLLRSTEICIKQEGLKDCEWKLDENLRMERAFSPAVFFIP